MMVVTFGLMGAPPPSRRARQLGGGLGRGREILIGRQQKILWTKKGPRSL